MARFFALFTLFHLSLTFFRPEVPFNESLWNNSFLTAIRKPVFHQGFLNKNILNVRDLLTESGSVLTWQKAKQLE